MRQSILFFSYTCLHGVPRDSVGLDRGTCGSETAEAQKINLFTFTEFLDTDGHDVSWVRLGCVLGWVLGPDFHYGICWVGLDRSFGELCWVEEIGRRDNCGLGCFEL